MAESQFAQRGYEGAHLQRIAEEAGVQKTALYYYFPSKGALYVAVLSAMLEDFDRVVCMSLDRAPAEGLQPALDVSGSIRLASFEARRESFFAARPVVR